MPLSLPALITLLLVLWLVCTAYQVGRARVKYKVAAPATTGDPAFERAFRVQMNEIENLIAFLPSLWIFAWFGNPRYAALLGLAYLAGRIVFAIGYWREARRRHTGYMIATIALAVTWVAALASVVRWIGFA